MWTSLGLKSLVIWQHILSGNQCKPIGKVKKLILHKCVDFSLKLIDFKGSDMTKIEELSIDLDYNRLTKPYIYSLKIIEKS